MSYKRKFHHVRIPRDTDYIFEGEDVKERVFYEAKGGMTICFLRVKGLLHCSFAFCSTDDPFVKKVGRELAVERMEEWHAQEPHYMILRFDESLTYMENLGYAISDKVMSPDFKLLNPISKKIVERVFNFLTIKDY